MPKNKKKPSPSKKPTGASALSSHKLLWAGAIVTIGILSVIGLNYAFSNFPNLMEKNHKGMIANFGMPFTLASSKGGVVKSEELKGKPYGMFFGFTHCPEICPTTMYEMTKALEQLGPEAKDFRLFFVSVDPEQDTVQAMSDYVANFDPRIEALVPSLEELPALAKAYRVIYEKVPNSDGSYTMNHTATVFLFDKEGNLANAISYDDKPEVKLEKLKKLVSQP